MELGPIDIAVFVAFMGAVVGVSLWAGRRERSSEDYFLAGRSLGWGLIGFSLIASNISTEHFVGMAGQAFGRVGLAIASYEWMSAITLVIVALWLLPKFLRAGIYTMPEYLEYRYDGATRTIMSVYLMVLYVVALLATVLYSGAQGLNGVFGFPDMLAERFGMSHDDAVFWSTMAGAWFIGIIAAVYTIYGGLKSVVWSDLLQGGGLLIGGAIVLYLGLRLVGGGQLGADGGVIGGSVLEGWSRFREANADKLHTVLPWNDPDVPWLAVFVGGLWIPNLFYWGLNQFITQRTLGAKSLAEGQKGIFLAAWLKLLIPFIIVLPGIIAFQLYNEELLGLAGGDLSKAGEIAYPHLIARIMPPVLRGVMLAALAGAVMSTFNSGINSASTIFTVDIYNQYIQPKADARRQVLVGRLATAAIALFACLISPLPGLFEGVFRYIQEIWGFISPGIVAAFAFGLIVRRAPAVAGRTALLLSPILYGLSRVPGWVQKGVLGYSFQDLPGGGSRVVRQVAEGAVEPVTGLAATVFRYTQIAFLHHMAIIFVILCVIMAVQTLARPLTEKREMPVSRIDVKPWRHRYLVGGVTIAATVVLYILFR